VLTLVSGSSAEPWLQVLGRIAVHHTEESFRLTGSGQRLLAVLVAAGPDGVTAEKIAEEIWGDQQPNPWRPALRMAVARLRKQLPDDWDIVAAAGSYQFTLDVGWIDAWRLDEIAGQSQPIEEADLSWVLAGPPFGDIDQLELVGASAQNLQMLQIAVAERFCSQRPTVLSTATCSMLTALLRDHPYNDRLAMVVVGALASADRRTEALLALKGFSETYANEFGTAPEDIEQFLSSGGETGILEREPAPAPVVQPTASPLARELRHLVNGPLFGRDRELEVLLKTKGALVTGISGSGKSRLLAELIVASAEVDTTFMIGEEVLELPLAAFAVALPSLRDELLTSADSEPELADERAGDRAIATRAWPLVLEHFEQKSAYQPQRIVVDDAHLLDNASLGLLRLLIRSSTAADVSFVVCGRSDYDGADWVGLLSDAKRLGLDPIELDGLGVNDLEVMIARQFPDANYQARRGLAVDVHEASSGLPAVAVPIIAAADAGTLTIPDGLGLSPKLSHSESARPKSFSEVAAAAAVLGYQFSIGSLIAITDLEESAIFRALDELWSSGLIVETEDPDKVRFRHMLIHRDVLDEVPRFRSGQLHRRAAELTTDPHDRANHQVSAGPLVSPTTTAESLRASAQIYADRRQWRKAAAQIRRISVLGEEHLDIPSMILWSAALERSGADGSAVRQAAYEKAIEQDDWVLALDAALAGLPQAERPEGDSERIRMLESIPINNVPEHRRFDLVHSLGRQHSLSGHKSEVLQYADQALAIATNDEEIGLSHILRWNGTRHVAPNAHTIPPEVVYRGSRDIQLRVAQINALNLAEKGEFFNARNETARFAMLASEVGDSLRIWHARAMQGMFLMDECQFEEAEKLADENFQFANLHDNQQGISNWVGTRVFAYDCQGRLPELHAELEPYRSTLSQLLIGRAAMIMVKDSVGEKSAFGEGDEVRELVKDTLDRRGSTLALLTMIFMSRFVRHAAPELVAPVRALLSPYGDDPVVASFGAGSFGPTTRYVAMLTSDSAERVELLDQSIAAADRHGPLYWRIRTRLDAAENGNAVAMDEASTLALSTEIEPLVTSIAKRLRLT